MSLSQDQQAVVDEIKKGLHQIYIVSGEAGSGKSFLVEYIKSTLGATVCATTARAALNIPGGITLDRLFCITRSPYRIYNLESLRANLRMCKDIVIIDEGSPIGLEMAYVIFEAIKMPEFKNKILVIFGDWAQTRPVKDSWPFTSSLFTLACKLQLTSNHRQKDNEFLRMLVFIRKGIVNSEVTDYFAERVEHTPPEDDRYMRAWGTSKKVVEYNTSKLNKLIAKTGNIAYTLDTHTSYPSGCKVYDYKKKQELLDNCNFAHNIPFCVDARVVITANSPNGLFANSDTGTIKGFTGINLELDDSGFLKQNSQVVSIDVKLDRNSQIVKIYRFTRSLCDVSGEPFINIHGFPLAHAWAVTIHRSQGLTLDYMYLDMASIKAFEYAANNRNAMHGLAYVGLSRVRDVRGLLLNNWVPSSIVCDDIVKHFL